MRLLRSLNPDLASVFWLAVYVGVGVAGILLGWARPDLP